MGNFYAFIGALLERLRVDFQWGEIALSLVTHVPLAIVLAWIASKGATSVPIDYLFVGVLLMSIWNRVSIRLGWSITADILGGTYDYIATARTPLAVVLFARALALTMLGTMSALLPLVAILLVSGKIVQVSDPLLFVFGLAIGAFSVLSVAIVFAPLFLLVRGREGFFNVIRPLGVVLGGFFYPVALLAPGIEFLARLLPAAWAMDAVVHALQSEGNILQGSLDLAIALVISFGYLLLAYFLLVKVERRVRVAGNMRAF